MARRSLGLWIVGVALGLGALEPAGGDPAPAAGKLELEIQVSLGVGDRRSPVYVTATLRNVGARSLTFYLPEFHDAIPFPEWRFTRADGAVFAPYGAPFQSMWTEGDQGTLITLEPQRVWTTRRTFDLFVPAGPEGGAGLTPLPLDGGPWKVSCRYEQKDARIPVGGPNFTTTYRVVEGLWTGRVESAPREVVVKLPPVVSLRIDAPRDHVPGEPYPLTVTVRNDTGRLASLPGVLTVSASSKPHGTFSAQVILDETCRQAATGETQTLGLGVAATRIYVVDLASLRWHGGRAGAPAAPLAERLGQGIFALSAAFAHPDHSARLDSNGLWRYVAPRPAGTPGR